MQPDDEHWSPRCDLPADLVRPARIDPTGRTGPTRGQTQRQRWRQVAHGWYVPHEVDSSRVEQRILEQAMRVRRKGAVTAWAALRWQGAAYFDGSADERGGQLRVPLLRPAGGRRMDDGRALVGRTHVPPYDRVFVRGVWCTTPERAVFDEVARRASLRPAVAAICMTLAAGIATRGRLREYADQRVRWVGIPLFREAVGLANECFRSGPEVYMYLRWLLDAHFPQPLVNPPVFDRHGRLLGYPDLLDPVAGVVGEYDGAAHRGRARHRSDVARMERFRDCGLEPFTLVAGDLADEALTVGRMVAARSRARFLREQERQWTLRPPPWWEPPSWLPARYRPSHPVDPAA